MPMTPEEIYDNFSTGDATPLSDVEYEVRDVIAAYRSASERFAELSSGMTSVWSGDAAHASIEKAQPLVTSLRESADLLDTCAGSHGAQTTAFNTAVINVQPVPPAPEKPTPTDMIKAVLTDGPAAPFERIQSYKDGVEAYNAAARQNLKVMDDYYWATEDNQRIPDTYPFPEMTPDSGQHDVMNTVLLPQVHEIEIETGQDTGGGKEGDGGDRDGGGGGDPSRGGFDGLDGSGPGGADTDGPKIDDLDLDGPNLDDLDGPGGPDGPPGPDNTTPNWAVSSGLSPDTKIITDPPRTPPMPPPLPDGPPTGVVPGPGNGSKNGRDPDTTVSSGANPAPNTFDPAKAGLPPAMGPNRMGGDQSFAGGQFGQGGVGNGSSGKLTGGAPGPVAPGAVGRTGGGGGRMGGPGGMGMAPSGSQREEDKEHSRPEYLFEPDPNAIFGTDERASSPVIGAAWQPERFDDDEK